MFNYKYIIFQLNQGNISMESYANFAEFMPDPKNSLLSLQFLDDVA